MSPLNEHQEHQQGDASHQIRVEQRHRQALQVARSRRAVAAVDSACLPASGQLPLPRPPFVPPTFLQVWASALLPLPARTAFDLITHPENEQVGCGICECFSLNVCHVPRHKHAYCCTASRGPPDSSPPPPTRATPHPHPPTTTNHAPPQIFRHLDACTHHEVLHEDAAAGRRLVESEHVASWSLLVLRGTLKTRCVAGWVGGWGGVMYVWCVDGW